MMKVAIPKNMHEQLARAQSSIFFIVAACTVVTVFCLIATKSLMAQGSYQGHVLTARQKAVKQIKDNVSSAQQLASQYNTVFENSGPVNVLGGKNDISQNAIPPDGDNARLVLNALPSSYDFPALVTTISKILNSDGIQNPGVSGSDQSASIIIKPSPTPTTIPIVIPISGTSSLAGVKKLFTDLQRSTRPFDITNIQISGGPSNMSFSLSMTTYVQPPKSLDITTKVIKK
jgi:hypothetical protein